MARRPEPWYWEAREGWYVTIGGKRHPLAKGREGKAEAYREFYRLMAETPNARRPSPPATAAQLCETFLDHSQRTNAPATYEMYRRHLQSFCDQHGELLAAEVRPRHISAWLKTAGARWSDSTRSVAVTAVKRVFSWAEREGRIADDPIRRTPKPRMRARERLLNPEELARIEADIRDQPFRDFFVALVDSGCRPGEAAKVQAKQVDQQARTWTLTFKGDRARTIYLSDRLLEISRRLCAAHPEGPIFRNVAGRPWTRSRYSARMRIIRRRLGLGEDVVAYLTRHAFATDALEKGVPAATVAELMGHKSIDMLEKHYSKLREKRDHLRAALRKIRPPIDDSGTEGA